MKRKSPEAGLHLFTVQLLKLAGIPKLLYWHTPNEGRRSPRTGDFLKQLGMLPGVADLTIIMPGGRACFLELKSAKGVLSADQRAFRAACEAVGAAYAYARTPEEVKFSLSAWGAIRVDGRGTMPALAADRRAA